MQANSFLTLINSKLKTNNYMECSALLQKEIIYLYTTKIKNINNDYHYSSTVELFDDVKKYLNNGDNSQYTRFFNTINDDTLDIDEKAYILLDIYNNIQG